MALRKIIAAGESESGQAALDAAVEYGFPYCGWIPEGRLTGNEPFPEWHPVQEMPSSDYPKITLENITDSDGTLIFSRGDLIGEAKLMQSYAELEKIPILHIDLLLDSPLAVATKVDAWINRHQVEILNVAGPRAKDPKMYDAVKMIMQSVLLRATLGKS